MNINTWYPATGFFFQVEVAGFEKDSDLLFKEVTGLNVEVGSEDLVEGGENTFTWSLPKQPKSGTFSLKRGMYAGSSNFTQWVLDTIHTNYTEPITLREIKIKLLDMTGISYDNYSVDYIKPIVIWTISNARPTKYNVSDLDSMKNEVLWESIEFTYTNYRKEICQ
ncbi:phage tail protein [Aureivirga marina]|uniref:phage tail protein n=1 Tax=Aureivirga marina TaxID=1182451 RepID=UPI0018CBC290|nr:phage tail protein [Aureivirga marina]